MSRTQYFSLLHPSDPTHYKFNRNTPYTKLSIRATSSILVEPLAFCKSAGRLLIWFFIFSKTRMSCLTDLYCDIEIFQ